MRLLNLFITILLIVLYTRAFDEKTILFIISSSLMLLFANIQNDYIDREIDLRKGKKRIVFSEMFHWFLLITSLIISIFVNKNVFFCFLFMSALINFYNLYASKRVYGFFITSSVVAMGVFSLSLAFGFRKEIIYLVMFAFLFNVQREIVKSLIDYEYDFGFRRTIAIAMTRGRTRFLIKIITIFIIVFLVVCSYFIRTIYFLIYITISTTILLIYIFNIYDEKLLSNIIKLLMTLGFVSLLI